MHLLCQSIPIITNKFMRNIFDYFKIAEYKVKNLEILPNSPNDNEKYLYVKRKNLTIALFSIISFVCIYISLFNFLSNSLLLWPLYLYFILTGIYFFVSLFINLLSSDFNLKKHNEIIKKWKNNLDLRVDIFLPTAGENLSVLKNTWEGVLEIKKNYKGKITVYCLDDSDRQEVRLLSLYHGFNYVVRPKRGWFKKSGNLRYGYKVSNGEFIAIFDADFRPRKDFLKETLPYFLEYKDLGLVQSPQYFDVDKNQNWLQRGAGEVQELFYRISQVSRQSHNASICVGSNAVYRRVALEETGGTALIEHSEDVHTGFNIRMRGWSIQYIPIILAKGLCPSDMESFFKQQYRWCLGSISLLASKKFWQTKISFIARLSYFSGFLYYIHTAITSFIVPIIPIVVILFFPDEVRWQNYIFIVPSLIFVQVVYPLWHRATYGIEAWSTRVIYGWAHWFAIINGITGNTMSWQPTGTKSKRDLRYIKFRIAQIVFNLIPGLVWIYLASEKVFVDKNLVFLPILIGGIYYYLVCSKVSFYVSTDSTEKGKKFLNFLSNLISKTGFISPILVLFLFMSLPFIYKRPEIKLSYKNTMVRISQGKVDASSKEVKVESNVMADAMAKMYKDEILRSTWDYYKKTFVDSDGKSIDPSREYKTTSEGQSYIMLRSVIVADKEMFDKSWDWTRKNLQTRDDKLFSWLWGGNNKENEKVVYEENATDADEDIALALILASFKWDKDQYLIDAKGIVNDLWEKNVVEQNGKYYLLAGSHFEKPKGLVVNPSYLSPASYRIFSAIDKKHDWEKLADDSYRLLNKINLSNSETVGLPPDWILVDKKGEIKKADEYIDGETDMYGYDAFRTFWRVALDAKWFDSKDAKEYLSIADKFFSFEWNKNKKINAIYTVDGLYGKGGNFLVAYTAPLSVFEFTNKNFADQIFIERFDKSLNKNSEYWGSGKDYYEQNWAWLSLSLYTNKFELSEVTLK